jgi:nitric-oxide synthase, bacterial
LTESLALLKSVPFLAALTDQELEQIAAQVTPSTASPGELILREGEVGDRMYVIERGSVQVLTTSFDGSDLVLARLEPGQWFGEQALLPGGTGRRNASVRALEPCGLLVLSRELLHHALARNSKLLDQLRAKGEEQRALRTGKLREGAFASLGLGSGAGGYRIEHYPAGAAVFHQRDPGDRLYLILSGRAKVKYTEGGRESVLAELLAGQFFGELAILRDAPRSATVEASEDLDVVSLDGAWFREAHERNPALRSLMNSLSSIYLLPRRGLLTLQTGQLDGKPTVTAVHNLPDGRRVLSTRLAGAAAFTAQVLDAGESAAASVVYENQEHGIYRELQVAAGKLTGLEAEGEWTGLGDMFGMLLDGTPVEDWQLVLFRERGDFHVQEIQPLYEQQELICTCTQTTCGKIMQAIRENCTSLEAVAKRTGATQVCGGCAPLVRELLGQSGWTAARVVEIIPRAEDVRSFRLRPVSGPCRSWRPGQHLVLQARIDNRWVQRAYTLSCAPGGGVYEITVKKEPQGVFSRWLFDRLPPDTMLRVSEPGGEYCLPDDQGSDVVCLVGGIGVTPALAMARTLAVQPRPFRLHVHYSASEEKDLACLDELLALQRDNPRISVETRVTRKQGRFGPDQVRELADRFPDALYFLCGSPSYMSAVSAHLRECGVSDERVRIEIFTVAGAKVGAPVPEQRCPVAHAATVTEPLANPLEQARSMLRDCYQEANALSVFEARWRQVEVEFERTRTYRQTYEELLYAARVAWRNSVKCIGRLYWQGLAVRDFRHAETEDEMFEAIFSHIETAMNGGNLRPLMTVFPPTDKNGHHPRVWNTQIFRYAGYQRTDGSVLGDPANVEFTEAAIGLGWTPPAERSRFDLLPVILQAGGRSPQWREIPKKLVVEVPILHPDFPGLQELGLKWYALRLVSGVMLDAGGVQYTAAPFNGWSMGTEIGARIFGDVQRYNQLPQIAKVMGLDTSSDRTLWRDRALVELNVAVLYSFDKAGVKIMDHHSASQAFMKFDQQESRAGRTAYARWSWIVPPISGSAMPVFHSEWPDVELKPNYVTLPEPWKK